MLVMRRSLLVTARRAAPAVPAAARRRLCAPPAKVEQLCDDVCQLNVLELAQFLELFKEKAGLTDADLQGGGGGGGGGGG
eukprot:CAMPEP_0119279906 /NCGR_PEP_ID=MMETSP1329-20130426/21717_1 /TAXON_ID=114041 /ORGANISM="Genus nov. species nov., Strain RCC1024" /LENGTH=79 /DNA_ID=CAMNT_0007280471 /DNA_START=175 /DNA_END=410 /DNA_ORIENTATION=-